ncbi:MAG: aspartate carbamoyltransferase [Candidatus Levybacteria bacterium]|nr:aspartate carbamoyltransferase [Candidatus Levybacteria bacterium]
MQKIGSDFKGKDILSLDQFDPQSLTALFTTVDILAPIAKEAKPSDILKGNIVTLLFFEPSSRTFGSFSGAIKRLGGQTIDVQDPIRVSSVAKGETLSDTIKVFESYCDAIVIRHPEIGAPRKAAEAAFFVPVINAGDGTGEHPTQALMDLYTLNKRFGRLDSLTALMAGDILNGRTVHSLIRGLSHYKNNTVYLLSPEKLKLQRQDFADLSKRGIKLIEITSEQDIPKDTQFWYWTRVQKERFSNLEEYEKLKHSFIVTPELLSKYGTKDMVLMHPLPRVGEITTEVDDDPRAIYLTDQLRNGKYMRMALMALVLGKM